MRNDRKDLDMALALLAPFVEEARRAPWLISKRVGDMTPQKVTILAGQARAAVRFLHALKEKDHDSV